MISKGLKDYRDFFNLGNPEILKIPVQIINHYRKENRIMYQKRFWQIMALCLMAQLLCFATPSFAEDSFFQRPDRSVRRGAFHDS